MNKQITLLASIFLWVTSVEAETVIPGNYMVAGKIGDTWTYVRPDSTRFTWTLSEVATGPNAGRFERGNIDSGIVYDVTGNVFSIFEFDKSPVVPPWMIGASETGEVFTDLPGSIYLFWKVPSVTVAAGTFNDVLALVWLDDNTGPNSVNELLGLSPGINMGVTDVNYYASGFGEIKLLGVDASTGNTDGFGYELVSTNVESPTCDIQLNQTTYIDGDTVTSNVLRLANQTTSPIATELKIWLSVPGIAPVSVTNAGADGSLVFPAGMDMDYGPLPLFTITAALPRGSYEFSCRMLDPVTGEAIATDINAFDVPWEQVVFSGFGDANNVQAEPTVSFDGYLYAGTENAASGGQLWRSADGMNWSQVVFNGFGDVNNEEVRPTAVYNGYLFAATYNSATGGEVWRSSDGTTWQQVNSDGFGNADNVEVYPMVVFNGYLYSEVTNDSVGGGIWRTMDGLNWQQVVFNGFGNPNNTDISFGTEFGGYLYAGTENETTGGEIWRTTNGTVWEQAMHNYFPTAVFGGNMYAGTFDEINGAAVWRSQDGTTWQQVAFNGFGDINNVFTYPALVFDGYLYTVAENGVTGGEIWRSSNGIDWQQDNTDGFGDASNAVTFSWTVFNNQLYVGTENESAGGEVWRRSMTPSQ